MQRTRHNRATGQTADLHAARLHEADAALQRANGELQRARALRDDAIRAAAEAGLSLRQMGSALGLSAEGVRSALPRAKAAYDTIGTTYARTRQPDPRIEAAIWTALGDAKTVVNVGAGAGSYEPPSTMLAVEPSLVMISQRPPGTAPAAVTSADRIPLPDRSVDAALAVLTIHHWPDLEAGIREMQRVARRVVMFVWDQEVCRDYWLSREYLPAITDVDQNWAVPISRLCALLGTATVTPVMVPHDCRDGFLGAYWRRPAAYLDPMARAGISAFSKIEASVVDAGLERLAADLASGAWHANHADLLERDELDVGYRLVVAQSPEM